MIAAIAQVRGGIDDVVLRNIPIPELKPHEILIKIIASGVNPVDWKALGRDMFQLPYTVGSDISGIIEKTGTEVKDFNVGDEVIGSLAWKTQGAFAEYCITEEKYITHKPKNKTHIESAAIPLAALTAWQALFDKMNLQPRQRILIHAAAGGVGLFALQLAKWKGAYVYATASQRNFSFLVENGADEVIDYREESKAYGFTDLDGVLDSISDEKTQEHSFKALRKGGVYVSILGALNQEKLDQYQITGKRFLFQSDPAQLRQIVDLVERELIHIHIEATYQLTNFKNALFHVQKGRTRGKVVITTI